MTYPRLCFVGPMLNRHPGWVIAPGEVLAQSFQTMGYPVIITSSVLNRYRRMLDIMRTIITCRRQIDIMCLQVYGGPSFVVEDMASWLGKRFGHRIILVLHGGNMPNFMAHYPQWTRRVLSRGEVICTPSPFLQHAVSLYGFNAEVIPNPIDLSQYPYRQRSTLHPNLLWMRTFEPLYNPAMAMRVFARIKQTVPEARLVMGGQARGQEGEIEQMARDLGLSDAVRFVGFLDMAGKAREGNAADVFLNTNHVDNMPVSVVEACAMGLPIIATNVGGLPYLLTDGETGLLVPDDDDEAMSAAVQRLLQTPALAAKLSAQGRAVAERSSWEVVRNQWEALFARLHLA
ncbi:MAG TPA: glycosyltransferase family 4 protein [Aggregatilineaceae bacterium]|nr:glycosyltransferase family 4 protein [Aggregatilineaceae bacterium]